MAASNDKWFQHEALDRCFTIQTMLEQLLGFGNHSGDFHPGIWNDECRNILSNAHFELNRLYQEIGNWEEDKENV